MKRPANEEDPAKMVGLSRCWRKNMRLFSQPTICVGLIIFIVFIVRLYNLSGGVEKMDRGTSIDLMEDVEEKKPDSVDDLPITFESSFHKIVHLDLKGAPPKVTYYRQLFQLLQKLGATGLLLEYEDMFPYKGDLKILARAEAYTEAEIGEILQLAQRHNLVVIPLVQTFGHFEFVLKHNQFHYLRAEKNDMKGVNPSKPESLTLIRSMIDQLLALHPDIQYLHIGGDEVYTLGKSPESIAIMNKESIDRDDIYLRHIVTVSKFVRGKNIVPIIWDDMMRKIPLVKLQKYEVQNLIEPMVWNYLPNPAVALHDEMWDKYSIIFPNLWIASAFKGATGQNQYIVDPSYHLSNHRSWMRILDKHGHHFQKIQGIALTGWQRYDHNLPLCELLPVAIPSLAVNLHLLAVGPYNEVAAFEVAKMLNCDGPVEIQLSPSNAHYHQCHFPGSSLYDQIHKFHEAKSLFDSIKKQADSSMTDFNIKNRYVTAEKVKQIFLNMPKVQGLLVSLSSSLPPLLSEIYYQHTVTEWMQKNVEVRLSELEKLAQRGEMVLNRL